MKKKTLNRQLSAYGRQAKADLNISKRGFRSGPTTAFAVAAATVLAAPDTAQASIIYTAANPNQFFSLQRPPANSLSSNGGNFFVDVDGDGKNDLWVIGDFFGTRGKTARMLGLYGAGIGTFTAGTVGPSRVFQSNVPISLGSLGGARFMDFRFQPTGSGHVDYGWLELSVNSYNIGSPNYVQAVQWAYDDSGAPIVAGQLPPPDDTPEPGTLSTMTWIGLLALGAAGRAEMKRRKALRTA